MPKNSPPPICPKCGMPMRFVLVKTGGRKFRCVDCDVTDLLNLPEVTKHSHGRIKSSGLNCFRWLWRWSSGYTKVSGVVPESSRYLGPTSAAWFRGFCEVSHERQYFQ